MKTAQGKTAEYYLGLRYAVTLKELAPEDGGGYVASYPELGSKTFQSVADTPQEALEGLDEVRRVLIPMLVDEGMKIPEPQAEAEKERFSGNIMIRIPPALHAQLSAYSKSSNVSINKLATQYLSQGLTTDTLVSELKSALKEITATQTKEVVAEFNQRLGNFHSNSYRASE